MTLVRWLADYIGSEAEAENEDEDDTIFVSRLRLSYVFVVVTVAPLLAKTIWLAAGSWQDKCTRRCPCRPRRWTGASGIIAEGLLDKGIAGLLEGQIWRRRIGRKCW